MHTSTYLGSLYLFQYLSEERGDQLGNVDGDGVGDMTVAQQEACTATQTRILNKNISMYKQCFGSGWIRIQIVAWIRISIRYPDPARDVEK